jgi:hypothetical protein
MSFSAPTPPDPTQVSNAQQGYNQAAATAQNTTNSYNQSTPFGSINYTADPNSPSGYSLNTSLSPTEQGLFNTYTGTQGQAGNIASNLLSNTAGMYSQPFNGNNQAVTDKLNQWSSQYLQPIFNQQQSNTDAQLRSQGLTPGSEAYNNAENLLARNQGDVTNQYLQQNQQQGFNQALQEYQTPLQTASGLFGMSAPQGPTQQNTPTAQIQPANYSGQVQQNYQQQNQNYENTLSGLFGIPTALAGGWGKAGFPGASSIASMFA